MPTRTIAAIGGGGLGGLAGDALDAFAVGLAGRRPRTLLITTAWGVNQASAPAALDALARVARPQLFRPEKHATRLGAILAEHAVVWVTGGDVRHLLAVWRELGLDEALRDAWEAGVVLVGSSAGALCWFEDGVTRRADGTLGALGDGLGLLPGSFCAHADAPDRLPAHRALVAAGMAAGYAAEDRVALRFEDGALREVVTARAGASAYRIEAGREQRLDARVLG